MEPTWDVKSMPLRRQTKNIIYIYNLRIKLFKLNMFMYYIYVYYIYICDHE